MSTQATEGTKTTQVNNLLIEIQEWPHWGEIQLGAQKEYNLSTNGFYRILPEYQKFIALCAIFPGLAMLSEKVDVIWHSHILNTIRYQEFCQQFAGRFIHHLPCSSYQLYGFSNEEQGICQTPPSTCYGPDPAPPDPSPLPQPPKKAMYYAIIEASPCFVEVYKGVFGYEPSTDIWERVALVDGIAI